MTSVLVEDGTFIARTIGFVFFVFELFGSTHSERSIEMMSFFFVKGSECKRVELAFGKLMILIVLHFINNYYETKRR